MTIGRDLKSDFHITSIEISRVHARIFNLGSSWYLENLRVSNCNDDDDLSTMFSFFHFFCTQSTNGVYVNGQKVAWRVRLSDNCFVTFGPLKSSSFRYVFVENYKVSMNIQRNVTLSKTIQRSFVLGGTSSGAGAGAVTATGGDITHLSTKPGEDVLRRDFDRKHFEQTMTINLMKIESNFSKLKKDVENQKQELDSIHAKAEMARKELIRIAEKMKGPDALKNVLLNEMSCSVCCDIMHEPTVLNCEHTFCFTCINAWSRRGKQHCPVCRKEFSRMTKSIRFHSLINLILDHYLSEDEKKERKESIESRLTDPAFTNEHSNDESSSQGNLDEILSGSDSSFRDAFSTLLNFSNSHPEYNVGNDSYVNFHDAVEIIDEDEVDGENDANGNLFIYVDESDENDNDEDDDDDDNNDDDDESDVSLDQVESMSPSSNSVHAPTSSSSPVSISSNFPDQLRLRRFSNLISRANESMLNFDENFGSFSNNLFTTTTTTTDNNSNDNDDSNDSHNGDDDADAGGISDIHAEEDEDDVMEVNTDQSVIFLDDVDDDHDDDNDVDAAADQGSSQVRIANGGSSRRLAAGNGVRNLNRNRRPVGIGHNASNRWNVRPMRNNNRQSLIQQRLHRIRNPPYPSRNGQSNEPLA